MNSSSIEDSRHSLYVEVLNRLDVCHPKHSSTPNSDSKKRYWGLLARLVYHEDNSVNRNSISRKYNGHIVVKPLDLSFVQFLLFMENEGIDLSACVIDRKGKVTISR